MQSLKFLFLFVLATSCKLDLYPEKFTENGKIKGRILEASSGKPVPGMIVEIYSAGSGFISTSKKDYQYTYTDENGYFQTPRMVATSSYNYLKFHPDSVRWHGYLLAQSGFRNENSETTNIYEFFRPRILKIKVNYDSSKLWPPHESYNIYQYNYNPHLHVYGSSINSVNKDGYLILSWFPDVRKRVRVDFTEKSAGFLSKIKFIDIPGDPCLGDTCYTTISLP